MTGLSPSDVARGALLPLTPLELASGLALGSKNPRVRPLPPESRSPRQVLEDVLLPHLQRSPTLVTFSGGRDSSAILAVAAHVARREGLPLPIPATNVIVGSQAADEEEWQTLVLHHLGLKDRIVRNITTELDVLSVQARASLSETGLLWPANSYMMRELSQAAAGGTLLTGVGGDEIFDESRAGPAAFVLAGQRRPSVRDLKVLVGGIAFPGWWRRRQARKLPHFPWLTQSAYREVGERLTAGEPPEHRGWAAQLHRFAHGRFRHLAVEGFQQMAGPSVVTAHPFLDFSFLAACATTGGRLGLGGRTHAMRMLVGDLLPEAVVARSDKAHFGDALWSEPSTTFRASGQAIDRVAADAVLAPLIDLDALSHEWSARQPHFASALLLQAAWLAGESHD